MGDERREAVFGLNDAGFGALQYLKNQYVQEALQELPDGYVFDDGGFMKKGDLTGNDLARYVADHDDDVPPARGLSLMLKALYDIGAVERGGRHRNTRKYKVRGFDQDDTDDIVSAIDARLEQAADETAPGERLLSYLEDTFDRPFTAEEVKERAAADGLALNVGSTLAGLASSGYLARDGLDYDLSVSYAVDLENWDDDAADGRGQVLDIIFERFSHPFTPAALDEELAATELGDVSDGNTRSLLSDLVSAGRLRRVRNTTA